MIHHDLQVLLRGKVYKLLALRGIAGKRLLDEDVLPILQRSLGQFVMRPDRRNDCNGVRSRPT